MARCFDGAAVVIDDCLANGETQAATAFGAGARLIGPIKTFKEMGTSSGAMPCPLSVTVKTTRPLSLRVLMRISPFGLL